MASVGAAFPGLKRGHERRVTCAPMAVSPIESATAGVRDMAAAVAFCRERLGLEVVSDARASVGLLGGWKRPVHETLRLVELAQPGRAPRLRLAEYETPSTRADTRSSLRAFVLPVTRDESVQGPDGLTIALRRSSRSCVVVAAPDLDAATRFHTVVLGWTSLEAAGVELVEGTSDDAVLAPGHLGLTHLTCACDDLDDVLTRIEAMSLEPVTRPTHVGLPGGRPGRVMLVRAPGGTLYELYEIAA
jgi:catechol 2,3-dioxygenase-like lactoylglutathione lyase family enzyme